MNKPNNPKCNTCFVTNNVLRCFNCKYKTKEWMDKNMMPIIMQGEKDLYKPKTEEVEKIIKALEEKPCIDVVSRQAVLNTLDFADKALDEDRTVETYKELLIACYKDLPSVKHTQKLGRWMFADNTHEHARCSECDYGNVDLLDGKPHNYCPNCGSFMMDNERTLEYADQDTMISAT